MVHNLYIEVESGNIKVKWKNVINVQESCGIGNGKKY
jgi:hypothetical protein